MANSFCIGLFCWFLFSAISSARQFIEIVVLASVGINWNMTKRRDFAVDKRFKWTSEDNKELINCWLLSSPDKRSFRKRMLAIWQDRNSRRVISEQLLAGQVNSVLR